MRKGNTKTVKKSRRVTSVAIVCILLVILAVFLVTALILLPKLNARAEFGKRVDAVAENVLSHVTLLIPDGASDILGSKPSETVMSKEDSDDILRLFLDAAENVSYFNSERDSLTDYSFRLRFRTDVGSYDFYLKDSRFYFVESDGVRHLFTPDDPVAYAALLSKLTEK